MNASFNYNENNVVKFTVNQDENETKNETKKMEVASASIDVSSLGGSNYIGNCTGFAGGNNISHNRYFAR